MLNTDVGALATIRFGYSMADVDRLARVATNSVRSRGWAPNLGYEDCLETAWHGIVELLYASEVKPERRDCLRAGSDAVSREATDCFRHHGWVAGDRTSAFVKFWQHRVSGSHDDFTEPLVERLALPQVLALLDGPQYEAVAALAAYGSQKQAALALGITPNAMQKRVDRARTRIVEAWIGEKPRQNTPRSEQDGSCRFGHPRDEHAFKDARGLWVCRVCKRNRNRRHRAGTSRAAVPC